MSLRTEAFRDNPRKLAILYGPLVLATDVGEGGPFPVIVADPGAILGAIEPVAGKPLTFQGSPKVFRTMGAADDPAVPLTPFYRHHTKPILVYWDVLDDSQWKARQEAQQAQWAKERELQRRTADKVLIGNEPSEREHGLRGEKTGAGEFGGRNWRHAIEGGWFSYDLKVPADKPAEIGCTYWGSDVGEREFDILVDGVKIATQKLQRNRPDVFFDETYAIPADLTKGKAKVTVRFQALPGKWAGGVFGCRTLARPGD